MARNDDQFESHPSGLDQFGTPVLADVSTLGLLNSTNVPRDASDNSVNLSDAMMPLTDEGTVIGDFTVPPTTQLQVLGPTIMDGSLNARGTSQFAESGAGIDELNKKRITIDRTASLVLKVDSSGLDAAQVILGDYRRTSGSTVPKSDGTMAGSLPVTTPAGLNVWSRSAAYMENTLLSTDLPAYDGLFTISGSIQALTSTVSGSGYGGVQTRARILFSIDGGTTWTDAGVAGTVANNSATPGSFTSGYFSGTFNFGTGTNIIVRVFAESYVRDLGSGGTGGGGGGGGGVYPL